MCFHPRQCTKEIQPRVEKRLGTLGAVVVMLKIVQSSTTTASARCVSTIGTPDVNSGETSPRIGEQPAHLFDGVL
jgi:hypothetical protein